MSLCINPVCSQPNHSDNDENRFCQSCGSQLELLGRYRILRLLSDKTGFGKVYQAYEQDTPKILKVLKEDLSRDAKAVELFQQEVTVLQQLIHPGIPQVDGYFQYQTRNGLGLHCFVMEQIEGPNLEQWLKQQENRPISQAQAIAWLKQLATILDVVHGQQYLHRDIKPSNIMIRPNGQLVLIDFGTARQITTTYLAQLRDSDWLHKAKSEVYDILPKNKELYTKVLGDIHSGKLSTDDLFNIRDKVMEIDPETNQIKNPPTLYETQALQALINVVDQSKKDLNRDLVDAESKGDVLLGLRSAVCCRS